MILQTVTSNHSPSDPATNHPIGLCLHILKAFAFIGSRQKAMLICSTIIREVLTVCWILILNGDPYNSFWIKEPFSILVHLYDKGLGSGALCVLTHISSALKNMEEQLEAQAQGMAFVGGSQQHQGGMESHADTI